MSHEIERALGLFFAPDEVFEVRVFGAGNPGRTLAAYCTGKHIDLIAGKVRDKAAEAEGVYFTPQLLKPNVASRCYGTPDVVRKRNGRATPPLTHDTDVTARRFLIIDIDTVRIGDAAKQCATDAERVAAAELADQVTSYLAGKGWPGPIAVDSGNGVHLYYRLAKPLPGGPVTAPADPLKVMLARLAAKFNTPGATIDGKVYNPSRIMRLPGTWNRKGKRTTDRPHRLCKILSCPAKLGEVSDDVFTATLNGLPEAAGESDQVPEPAATPAAGPTLGADPARNVPLPPPEERKFRATEWLRNCPIGVQGNRGSDPMMWAARGVVRGFVVDDDTAFQLLRDVYGSRCIPIWDKEPEIRHKISEAHIKPFNKPVGWMYEKDNNKQRRPKKDVTAIIPSVPPPGQCMGDPATALPSRDRVIRLGPDEARVVEECIAALGADPELFQRDGRFVYPRRVGILAGEDNKDHTGSIKIADVEEPDLRRRLTAVARLFKAIEKDEGEMLIEVSPTSALVAMIAKHPGKPGIRSLGNVTAFPPIRRDGTLPAGVGYDSLTGVYYDSLGQPPPMVPARVTQADANAAAARLLDLVHDFPFAHEAGRSVFLSMILTPLVRHLHPDGPSPLHLIDANIPGSGKGKLATIASLIIQSAKVKPLQYSADAEEMRKKITTIAQEGCSLVNLDNLKSGAKFGGEALDSALTSTVWSDRRLGTQTSIEAQLVATWYASGNNVQPKGDMARRVLWLRLESGVERPEDRDNFRYPDLEGHVRANRAALLADALTIIRGHIQAGRPGMGLKPLGSFEKWSALTRAAIVWAGYLDPCETTYLVREQVDSDANELLLLMSMWDELNPSGNYLTLAQAKTSYAAYPSNFSVTSDVLVELGCDGFDAKALSYKLRAFKDRLHAGRRFEAKETRTRALGWRLTGSPATDPVPDSSLLPFTPRPRSSEPPHSGTEEGIPL